MPRTLNNDVRVTLRLPGEVRQAIEIIAKDSHIGVSEWMRATLELHAQSAIGRQPEHLQKTILRIAELADTTLEDWILTSLQVMADADLEAYQKLEASRMKSQAVTRPDRCAHLLQYRQQGVFNKYCGFCGEVNPL